MHVTRSEWPEDTGRAGPSARARKAAKEARKGAERRERRDARAQASERASAPPRALLLARSSSRALPSLRRVPPRVHHATRRCCALGRLPRAAPPVEGTVGGQSPPSGAPSLAAPSALSLRHPFRRHARHARPPTRVRRSRSRSRSRSRRRLADAASPQRQPSDGTALGTPWPRRSWPAARETWRRPHQPTAGHAAATGLPLPTHAAPRLAAPVRPPLLHRRASARACLSACEGALRAECARAGGGRLTLQEELLVGVLDVLDNDGGAERVDDVGVIRVEDQRVLDLACAQPPHDRVTGHGEPRRAERGRRVTARAESGRRLVPREVGAPEKPMTPSSSSAAAILRQGLRYVRVRARAPPVREVRRRARSQRGRPLCIPRVLANNGR